MRVSICSISVLEHAVESKALHAGGAKVSEKSNNVALAHMSLGAGTCCGIGLSEGVDLEHPGAGTCCGIQALHAGGHGDDHGGAGEVGDGAE